MPTPLKTIENQAKHLTKKERAARQSAEDALQRQTRLMLKAPEWLSEEAREVWDGLRRKLRGVRLLDNLDAELLGIYCDAIAHYRAASKLLVQLDENGVPLATDERIKQAQAWARIVSTYAEKLGLSPTARARLAKRKAESPPLDDLEKLLLEDPADLAGEEIV
jgi:P27 family predicted phage terminase small subunit